MEAVSSEHSFTDPRASASYRTGRRSGVLLPMIPYAHELHNRCNRDWNPSACRWQPTSSATGNR